MASEILALDVTTNNAQVMEPSSTPSIVYTGKAPFIDEYVFNVVMICVNAGVVPMVALFGTVANLITMIVLYRMGLKDTTNILLFSLAVCDFLFLLLLGVRRVETFLYFVDDRLAKTYFVYVMVYLFNGSRYIMFVSVLHILFISTERFIAVLFPLKVSVWVSRKRIAISLVILYVASFLLFSTNIIRTFRITWRPDPVTNGTFPMLAYTEFYRKNQKAIDLFSGIFIAGFASILCLAVVSAFSIAIGLKLSQATKKRFEMSASSSDSTKAPRAKDVKVSRMLLTVCIVYVATNLPTIVLKMSLLAMADNTYPNRFSDLIIAVSESCNAVNSMANFIIYVFMASKFYKTLKEMFCC